MLIEVIEVMKNRSDYILVDTRPWEEYVEGHIPNSYWINPYDFILRSTNPEGIEELREYLRKTLAPLSAYTDQTIVFYENKTGMRAARAWWFLLFAGGDNGVVLHGGVQAWLENGGTLVSRDTSSLEQLTANHFSAYPVAEIHSVLATHEYVLKNLNNPNTVLVDARGIDEYNGKAVDPCCTVKGRISGAVHLNWEMLIDSSGKFLPKTEIVRIASRIGVTPDKEVIIYCHRGARSANTALALRWAGYERVRNYIGSWHEWSRLADVPIE